MVTVRPFPQATVQAAPSETILSWPFVEEVLLAPGTAKTPEAEARDDPHRSPDDCRDAEDEVATPLPRPGDESDEPQNWHIANQKQPRQAIPTTIRTPRMRVGSVGRRLGTAGGIGVGGHAMRTITGRLPSLRPQSLRHTESLGAPTVALPAAGTAH